MRLPLASYLKLTVAGRLSPRGIFASALEAAKSQNRKTRQITWVEEGFEFFLNRRRRNQIPLLHVVPRRRIYLHEPMTYDCSVFFIFHAAIVRDGNDFVTRTVRVIVELNWKSKAPWKCLTGNRLQCKIRSISQIFLVNFNFF